MQKKILHIISQHPDKTGSGVYLKAIMKEAFKKGYRQSLIYGINQKDEANLSYFALENEYSIEFESESLSFPIPGMSDVMPYNSTRYSDMNRKMIEAWKSAFEEKIIKAIEEVKPDIIYTHHLWLLTSVVVENAKDVPVFAFCHGTDIRQMKKGSEYSSYIVKNCQKADKIFSLSSEQKREISEIYEVDSEKIVVVGGGFNHELFFPPMVKERNKTKKLVYIGKLSYSKGIMSLLKAYEKISCRAELIIVGTGSGAEKEAILQEVKKSKKEISLKGQLRQREVSKLLRTCDVFILPSFYEGLSLVTIEALSSGLRAVVSEFGSLKEYLGKEINESGVIEYVKLPKMREVDRPFESEAMDFEARLTAAIDLQCRNSDREYDYPKAEKIYKLLKKKSWENIFAVIEQEMKKIN